MIKPFNTNFVANWDGDTLEEQGYTVRLTLDDYLDVKSPKGFIIVQVENNSVAEAYIRQHMADANHAAGFTENPWEEILNILREKRDSHNIDLAAPFYDEDDKPVKNWNGAEYSHETGGFHIWSLCGELLTDEQLLYEAHRIINGEIPDPRENNETNPTHTDSSSAGLSDSKDSVKQQPKCETCGDSRYPGKVPVYYKDGKECARHEADGEYYNPCPDCAEDDEIERVIYEQMNRPKTRKILEVCDPDDMEFQFYYSDGRDSAEKINVRIVEVPCDE